MWRNLFAWGMCLLLNCRGQTFLFVAAGVQMYFTKMTTVTILKIYQNDLLYNNKEVFFSNISDSWSDINVSQVCGNVYILLCWDEVNHFEIRSLRLRTFYDGVFVSATGPKGLRTFLQYRRSSVYSVLDLRRFKVMLPSLIDLLRKSCSCIPTYWANIMHTGASWWAEWTVSPPSAILCPLCCYIFLFFSFKSQKSSTVCNLNKMNCDKWSV